MKSIRRLVAMVVALTLVVACFSACDKETDDDVVVPTAPVDIVEETPVSHVVFDLEQADDTIRLMSYNIRTTSGIATSVADDWNLRKAPLVAHINKYSPDVIGMQEVMQVQLNYLAQNLPDYDYVSLGRDPDNSGESNPIFYKADRFTLIESDTFWLSTTPEKCSKYDGAGCRRICTYVILYDKETESTAFYVNTHLDHVSEEARVFGASVIVDFLEKCNYPFVLTGDFNTTAAGTAYAEILTIADSAEEVATSTMRGGRTYHGYIDSETEAGTPIDFIFLSVEFDADQFAILQEKQNGVYTSDHYAVIADIKIVA